MASVSTLSDLPDKWRLASNFYESDHKYFVDTNVRKNIAVIVSSNSDNLQSYCIIVFSENDAGIKNYLRRLIRILKEDDVVFELSKTNNQNLISDIYKTDKTEDKELNDQNEQTKDRVLFVEKILLDAMRMEASDIHLETKGNICHVRFRIYTLMTDYTKITKEQAEDFCNVCYTTLRSTLEEDGSGEGEFKMSSLLEGSFAANIDTYKIKGRILNFAHNQGDNADFIVRLIDRAKNNSAKTFRELGFSDNSCLLLDKLDNISSGFILTVGITGSGKSTTQQNMIQLENKRSAGTRKIISFEHPVEYVVDGVTQITATSNTKKVSFDKDFSFDNLNEKVLRADPNTIAIGELRDLNTAQSAKRNVASGHLVYGTLHCEDAISSFYRLVDLGLTLEDVCKKSFLSMIIYQHLLPKTCPHCSIPYKVGDDVPEKYNEKFVLIDYIKVNKSNQGKQRVLSERLIHEASTKINKNESLFKYFQKRGYLSFRDVVELKKQLRILNESSDNHAFKQRLIGIINNSSTKIDDINIRFKGNGCAHCHHGFKGVTPASEILIPDEFFLSLILTHQVSKARLYWETYLGGRTATEDCFEKIFDGTLDPRIVEEYLHNLDV